MFFSYILAGLLGILTTLIGTKKIEIKNRHIKEIGIYFLHCLVLEHCFWQV